MTIGDTTFAPMRQVTAPRDRALLAGLLGVFVVSGASGLIYQVVWVRQLSLVFGVTAYAISTVLSSFFAGLAIGSFLAGRWVDRLRSPLRAYAAVELLVAVAGLLTPVAFALARLVYVGLNDRLSIEGLWPLTAVRFVLAFIVLLVPTTLMGATLPLVVRSSLARGAGVARNLSLLYAANTFGAMAGTFLAGFELIGRYGLRTSLVIAACCNLIAATAAFALSRLSPQPEVAAGPAVLTDGASAAGLAARAAEGQGGEPFPWSNRVINATLVAFGISGGVSLAYEVVWARVLAIFFDASTYGFTAMLTMVLLGIGAGSWLISPVIARRWNWPLIFAGIEAVVGVLGLLAIPVLTHVIPLADRLGLYADPGPLAEFGVKFMAFAAFVVVFPPMLLLGASFPVAARIAGTAGGVGRRVGGVYAVNVFGGIAGALIGGFLLVPYVGVRASLLMLASLNLLLAVVIVWSVTGTARRTAAPALAALVTVVAGVALAPNLLSGIFRDRFIGQDVIWVDEGLENTVAVTDARGTLERKMYINGQPQASTVGFIAAYHQLIGHLPMLLHPEPKRALVIGLGGGATAGALSSHSGTEVDLVELSSAVVHAAPLFRSINRDVLLRPNVHLRVDDGRNFLLLSDRKYDVITADIIRPHHAGATNLYSREYYRLAKDALADDGIMVQWLEQLSEEHYKILMRSFVDTFPYVTLWAEGSLLVGSKQPLALDRVTLERRIDDPLARNSLILLGLDSPEAVLRLYTGNRDEALRYLAGEGRAITDDHPYVEFYRTLGSVRRPPDVSGFSRDTRQVLKDD
jgi:spermidine synthase